MNLNRKLSYHSEGSLMLVTGKGKLREIFVPFQVRCKQPIGILKINTIVYVDAVSQSDEHRILYKVLGQWLPYGHFQLVVQY
jgi:hypothetical protein